MIVNRSFYSRARQSAVIDLRSLVLLCMIFGCGVVASAGGEARAPEWMHAAAAKPQPAYDVESNAVLLYSDTSVTVISKDKTRTHVRQAYRILRPQGRDHGNVSVYTSGRKKVTFMRAWCIPMQGQEYEVTERHAAERSPLATASGLYFDTKAKSIQVPAPDPGSVVGYEYETEDQPFFLQDQWGFQGLDPVLESHYRLELPPDWRFRASWIHHVAMEPIQITGNTWEWTVRNVEGIRREKQMPALAGVAGKMVISFLAPGSPTDPNAFATWSDMGRWYSSLVRERLNASGPMQQQVATLTGTKIDSAAKMRAIARFIQGQIRYVAVELGIGSWQPHAASDVFATRYGDCKDKATLTIAMLKQAGIESYYVIINAQRDAVDGNDPAHNGFNHAIVAIRLPENSNEPALVATVAHSRLGKLLFFDPTDELTPFGRIRGELQSNYGLLVGPEGGELLQLPRQEPALTGIKRFGKFEVDGSGALYGEIQEIRSGDRAAQERRRLRDAMTEPDKLKLVEALLADSLGSYRLTGSQFANVAEQTEPLGVNYAFEAHDYAKRAGDMLLVRPRVLGTKSSDLLETAEPRKFAMEFDTPLRDSDVFEITLPAGYAVADMSPPVDVNLGFANYHSKTEAIGNTLRYSRTFELREVSLPADKAEELKKLYRIIAADERGTVVLKKNSTQTPTTRSSQR